MSIKSVHKKCPQKIPIISVQMKCPQKRFPTSFKKCPQNSPQKLSTKGVNKMCPQKVATKVSKKCPQKCRGLEGGIRGGEEGRGGVYQWEGWELIMWSQGQWEASHKTALMYIKSQGKCYSLEVRKKYTNIYRTNHASGRSA